MSKPVILIDLDGVMLQNYEEVLASVGVRYEDMIDYDLSNLTYDQRSGIRDRWDETDYNTKSLSQEVLIALEEMRKWARVIALSTPMPGHAGSKYRFLCRYFNWKDVILAGDKSMVSGDLIVEDKPSTLVNFHSHVIAYRHPYNDHLDVPFVDTFSEVPQLANEILRSSAYVN